MPPSTPDRSKNHFIVVDTVLNQMLGDTPGLILKRVLHWISQNEKKEKHKTHYWDGRWWARNTYDGWSADLGIPARTLRRGFKQLESYGLLLASGDYNRYGLDRTKWYTVDHEVLGALEDFWKACGSPSCHNRKRREVYQDFVSAWINRTDNTPKVPLRRLERALLNRYELKEEELEVWMREVLLKPRQDLDKKFRSPIDLYDDNLSFRDFANAIIKLIEEHMEQPIRLANAFHYIVKFETETYGWWAWQKGERAWSEKRAQ